VLLTVGRVVRPHGLHGEVLVEVRTDEPQDRYAQGTELHTGGDRTLRVLATRPHQGRLLVTFQGVADRDAAESLRGLHLQVHVPHPDDPDEFHDHQLIGLAAVSPAGELLGEVAGVEHGPGPDRLLLRRPDGRTTQVPFVAAIVPEVDLTAGRIVVDPPPGLLEL
jgi:16S rRNA processing protein RimM